METVRIKQVSKLDAACLYAAMGAAIGIIESMLSMLLSIIAFLTMKIDMSQLFISMILCLFNPFAYAIFFFAVGAFFAWLFNKFAGAYGGIRVNLEK